VILGRNQRGSTVQCSPLQWTTRAPRSLMRWEPPFTIVNEALQTRMQYAGSTLAVRQAGNAGFL